MVTRAELAAQRAAGSILIDQTSLAAIRTDREAGLSPEERVVANAPTQSLTIEAAYNAGSLTEAQEILASQNPGLTTSMTVGVAWSSVTGASPQATSAGVITVPAGNPGQLIIVAEVSGGVLETSLNGGAYAAFDPMPPTTITGDSYAFRLTGASQIATLRVIDNTTGGYLGNPFVIITT